MEGLPEDLLLEVFDCLSDKDLGVSGAVCKRYRKVQHASYDRLWGSRLTRVEVQGTVPQERACHTAVVRKGKMFVFGGMPNSTIISAIKQEACVLNLKTNKWVISKDCIPAVTEHTTVMWNDKVYLCGGYYDGEGRQGHLFEISDLDQLAAGGKPTVLKVAEADVNAPPPRSSHTAIVWKDSMFVFGGWDRMVPKNDLYCFNFLTGTWRQVHGCTEELSPDSWLEDVGQPPSPRRAHTAFLIKDTMYVVTGASRSGGRDVECDTSTINTFDCVTERWTTRPVFGEKPLPRSRCDGVVHEDLFYLCGGWTRAAHLGDLHVFCPFSRCWRKFELSVGFGVVQHSVVAHDDMLFLYGGYQASKEGRWPALKAQPKPVLGPLQPSAGSPPGMCPSKAAEEAENNYPDPQHHTAFPAPLPSGVPAAPSAASQQPSTLGPLPNPSAIPAVPAALHPSPAAQPLPPHAQPSAGPPQLLPCFASQGHTSKELYVYRLRVGRLLFKKPRPAQRHCDPVS
ncbi:Ras guanine nucleotide exchange factor F [Diplonema papillatum]|nr:Ras guanine nucleotide exchange factor F [Diplonema papillatum]